MRSTYGRILSIPGAPVFTTAALVARLPLSMAALGIVLLVTERGGSYGQATAVSAVYIAAAAVVAPVQGRLADRVGQGPVLVVCAVVSAIGYTALLSAVLGDAAAPLPHLAAAVAGLGTAQTGALARSRWSHLLEDDRALLGTAFAWEAVLDEVVFVVGPVLVTVLTLQVTDSAGLAVTALATVTGTLVFAAQRRTAPPATARPRGVGSGLSVSLLAPVVVGSFGLGIVFGSTEVLVVAASDEAGRRGVSGAILAVWAFGSLLAGTAVGSLPAPRDVVARLRWTSGLLALSFAPMSFIDSLAVLTAAMFLAGVMIAPTLIAATTLVERLVPRSRLTEAIGWTTIGMAAGVAPGAALVGRIVDEAGAGPGFLVPLAAAATTCVVVAVATPHLRRHLAPA